MDFSEKPLRPEDFRTPVCSEAECRRNTSPEVLHPLILGFLQAMTGQDWEVRVKSCELEGIGDYLKIQAEVVMVISKDKFGAVPNPLIVPKET
jgi:hypothetical protein